MIELKHAFIWLIMLMSGIAIGFSVCALLFMNWLLRDPDGPGGWKSRLQQLGADHTEHIKDWWGETKK